MIKIGELSNITGVSIQTIRFYESEGLISPIEVDRWTNYRYYDESSIVRLSEISHLKELGFSLKEIKNLSEESIKEKISQLKLDIKKLTKNINKLSTIRKEKGGFFMKNFINDEQVIGKWKKIAVVENKEDFKNNKLLDENIFIFDELYFLPNGEDYWVLSWTKGFLYVKDRAHPYEIIDGKLFVGVVDYVSKEVEAYAVYEQVDNKKYSSEDIRIVDNTDIPFIKDDKVVGFWESVDYVRSEDQFVPNQKFWVEDLFLKRYTFEPDGKLTVIYNKKDFIDQINWSKGVVIDNRLKLVSEYKLKTIDGQDYMFVEWKSGDYAFGGKIYGSYVLRKI